jgi:hypothetical protein
LIVPKVLFQEIPTTFASKVNPPGPEKDFHYFFSKKKVLKKECGSDFLKRYFARAGGPFESEARNLR